MFDIALLTVLSLQNEVSPRSSTLLASMHNSVPLMAQAGADASEEPIIAENRQFRFQFAGCEPTQNTQSPYRCNFLVENIGRDSVPISINGDVAPQRTSYIVDTQGIKIAATMIDVAGDRQSFYGTTQAATNVPFRVSLFLEALPEGEVSFIELFCTAPRQPGQRFSVQFRL